MVVVQLGWPDSCGRQTAIAPAPQASQLPVPKLCRGPALALTLTLVSVEMLGRGKLLKPCFSVPSEAESLGARPAPSCPVLLDKPSELRL